MSDNIYINVSINQNMNTKTSSQAIYNETYTQPICPRPIDYYATITNLVVPLNAVPLLIFPIIQNQTNPNLSTIIFGIKLGSNYFNTNVIFIPTSVQYPVPSAVGGSFTNSQLVSPYYYVYTYSHMIRLFNTAINTVCTNAGFTVSNIPYLVYNSVTDLITLMNVTQTFINTGAILYFNGAGIEYLDSFDLSFNSYNDINNQVFYWNLNPTPPNQTTPFSYVQDANTTSLWISMRRLLVVSNSIPANPEIVPTYNETSSTGQLSYLPIISSYSPNFTNADDIKSVAYYYPQSQYQLIDLNSTSPLYTLDLRIYWQDKIGNIYPIFLTPGQQANVRLAFVKKDLYRNNKLSLKM